MYKIAIMGEKESVTAFSALGMSVFFTKNEKDTKKTFNILTKADFAIIYVTEKTAEYLTEEIDKIRFVPIPAVILIPGINGNTGKGMRQMNRAVEKAVGSDILK